MTTQAQMEKTLRFNFDICFSNQNNVFSQLKFAIGLIL